MAERDPRADPGFGSFWHGPLNAFAWGSLASFAAAGAPLTVYSYDPALDLPTDVTLADAREICPDPSAVRRYLVDGKASLAAFADMFRYRMIRDTGRCWVDADIICLRLPDFRGEDCVFARQADAVSETLVNNAVLRLPGDHPALAELIETADAAIDKDQKWGALGPFLATPLLIKHGLYQRAREPFEFYPIKPEQYAKLFLPEWRGFVEDAVSRSTFLHLWSEAIRWSGWDFSVAPPEGSYLHDVFARLGALARFTRVSSEDEAARHFPAQPRAPNK